MNEIKCPNCGQVFPIDEAGYTAIAQQIRDKEFEKALKKQLDKEIELKTSGERISENAFDNDESVSISPNRIMQEALEE